VKEGIAPRILNACTRRKWVVKFTRPGHFTYGKERMANFGWEAGYAPCSVGRLWL